MSGRPQLRTGYSMIKQSRVESGYGRPCLEAYIAEGAKLVAPVVATVGLILPSWLACGAFTTIFGGFVYAGTGPAEKAGGGGGPPKYPQP